jgi:hypothetical protein
MWPSMIQAPTTHTRKSRGAHDLFTWGRSSSSADDLRAILRTGSAEDEDMRRHEVEELERWLQDDPVRTPTAATSHFEVTPPSSGFDDDFGSFMSSKPSKPIGATGVPSVTMSPTHLDGSLAFPSHADRSLSASMSALSLDSHYDFSAANKSSASVSGSVHSDHSDDELWHHDEDPSFSYAQIHDDSTDAHSRHADEHSDADLPSHAEIEATSRRIFGSGASPPPRNPFAPPRRSSASASASATANVPSAESPSKTTTFSTSIIPTWTPPAQPDPSSPRERKIFRGVFGSGPGDDLGIQRVDSEGSEDAPFDLNRVFSALQGMKEEISLLDDEEERKRAAARVALGLVYGLERENAKESKDASGGH